MQYNVLIFAVLSPLVVAKPGNLLFPRGCNSGNNCDRALTGTDDGVTRVTSRVSDCSSYFSTTIIPPTTTHYVYTSTVVGIALPPTAVAPSTTSIATAIPLWAKAACDTPVSAVFSSACSCAGVKAKTTILPSPSKTVTTVETLAPSGVCALDVPSRILPYTAVEGDSTLTLASCQALCSAKGYKVYGVEYANQCFCGTFAAGTVIGQTAAEGGVVCNAKCSGDSLEICGGTWAINVYTV